MTHYARGVEAPVVRINWRIAFGAATALSLLFAAQNVAILGFRQSYLTKLESQSLNWGLWLALLPVTFAVSRRAHGWPLANWRRWTFEVPASLAVALVHSVAVGLGHWLWDPKVHFGIVRVVHSFATLNFPSDVLRYWLIAAAYHTLAAHHEIRLHDVNQAHMARLLAEARLQNLEARLQPHFLFNALNTIAALIRRDPPAASIMVGQLSELLRAALSTESAREVTLAGELRLLDQYVAIQRTRFSDRLSFGVDAPVDTLQAYVPQMILQPIVENAVRHGIGPREAAGSVDVRASRAGSKLRLTVVDDGVGYGNAPMSLNGHGLGLRSTRARLATLYGNECAFDIRAVPLGGTIVTIELPFRTEGSPSPSVMS